MPFTPFHFGPGLLVKGALPRRFSFTTFAASQVVIDCEPLYHMLRHEYPVHRGLHTLIGATLAGAVTAAVALLLRGRFRPEGPASAIWLGGLIGGFSHPLLDGLMHPDVRPFAPFSGANPWLDAVSMPALHLGCVLAGILGAVLLSRRGPSKA